MKPQDVEVGDRFHDRRRQRTVVVLELSHHQIGRWARLQNVETGLVTWKRCCNLVRELELLASPKHAEVSWRT